MVASLSKPMNQEALETYHSQDNYYSQDDGLENSQWQGHFAAHQGLEGTITAGQWKQACQGQDPEDNELRRKQINSRAGWDLTLSACKSASLKALVNQDQTVLESHRIAVTSTVQYIEENCIYAQVKENGQLNREQTKQGQFALFEHDDNRNQEPQLHTHIVILNQTLCKDGKSRTLDSRELFNQKKTIGAYYDHAFAHQLKQKGYEIEWTSDHTFEIKGYQKEQLEAFSSRRQEIRDHLAQQNIKLEQATEEQKTIACLESRTVKIRKLQPIDHQEQRERWKQESDRLGIVHPQPRQNLQWMYDLASHPGSLPEVIQAATETATAYQVAVTQQALLRDCLRHSQGNYSPQEIEQALNESTELIPTQDGRLTTRRAIEREHFILQSANEGQHTQAALSNPKTVEQIAQTRGLNEGQQAGLKHIATSEDFITLLQGNAGAGKTYTMSAFKECLPPAQRKYLKGLAPSAAAAEILTQEAGIESITVDRYLLSSGAIQQQGKVLIVDEAGMLSSQQMERLIRKAQELQSRLILVGDTKQLSAIEAGAPFRLLQSRSELKTVTIEQNLRQSVPHLFDAASLAAQHQTNEALVRLDRCGCVQELPDPAQRNQTVVEQYLARDFREQAQTLILCDTNQDRRDITAQIRAAYLQSDRLSQDAQTIQILYPKTLDKQAITQAYNYSVGDVIRFRRPTQQFPESYYRVAEVRDQALILKDRVGQLKELPLHQFKDRDVFECQALEVREGDRLRFTRNHREWNQTNGQPFTIEALNPDNTIEIRTKGQRYTVTPDQLLHSDYAYCRTVYSSQGWTSAEAIWAPSQNPGQEQTYVALTRAKDALQILTLDRKALGLSVQLSQAQENALELVPSEPIQSVQPEQAKAIEPEQAKPEPVVPKPVKPQKPKVSDQTLWDSVQAIEKWKKTKPWRPPEHQRQEYETRIKGLRHKAEHHKSNLSLLKSELASLERSKLPFNLFDVNRERVERKQYEIRSEQGMLNHVANEYRQDQQRLAAWQAQVNHYREWESSEQSQKMQRLASALEQPEYKNRLQQMQQHRTFYRMVKGVLQGLGQETERGWIFEGERYRIEGGGGRLRMTRKADGNILYEGLRPETADGMPRTIQVRYDQNDWRILERTVKMVQAQVEQQQQRQPRIGFGR
jgi:conjugative relaxase-like TrwC/TraI family protein